MDICIADNLKVLRYKERYTLESLAEIISVSRQTISKWESGDSLPDVVNCIKLATLYKISLDELVYRPLKSVTSGDFEEEDGRICGVVEITQDNAVRLPGTVMDMFGIEAGDKMILLADKKQGLALVKCSQF